MPLQLFDRRAGSALPLVLMQRGQARLCPAQLGASLAELRAELVCDVLQRHLRASGVHVSSVAPGEPCDLEVMLEHAPQRGEARRLEVASVELAGSHEAGSLEALARQREAEALRYLLLATHYRAPMQLTIAQERAPALPELERAEQQVAYLYATKRRLSNVPAERVVEVESKPPPSIGGFAVALASALDADLDTPRALAETARFLRAVNELCDHALRKQGKLIRSQLDDAIFGLSSLAGRLGLGAAAADAWLERVRDRHAAARGISKGFIEGKLRERIGARERKDFASADAVRAELSALGIEIVDSPHGSSWRIDDGE